MPGTDLPLLIDAAEAAGKIAMAHFGTDLDVVEKPDAAGPVTKADIEVNAFLLEQLGRARPGYAWLSEESEDTCARHDAGTLFVVDPIDGTRSFIEGGRDWALALAVVEQGRTVAAVVSLPARGLVYSAALGGGARRNGVPMHVSGPCAIDKSTVLAARSNLEARHWATGKPPGFHRTFRSSLAYRMCLTAEGRFDAMLTLRPSWEWDIAAGALIVAESGGQATDRTGAALRFNNPVPQVNGVVAGGTIHADLIAALA